MNKINHTIMGELNFHDTYGWWQGKTVLPTEETSILYVKCSKDNLEELDEVAERYQKLIENLEAYKAEVADRLLKSLGNRMGNATKERIVASVKVQVIEIMKGSSAAIFFNDGNPRTSRLAVAEINEAGEIISLEILGE